MTIELMHGDCLECMYEIPDGSVDMVMADPPHGITACKWDSVIPLEPMWEHLKRVTKPNGAIVLTSSQPFTTMLISSNIKRFKQALVWSKGKGSNPLLAHKRIMQAHEDVVIFCYGSLPYNPQMREGKPYKGRRTGGNRTNRIVGKLKDKNGFRQKDNIGFRYPISVLNFSIHCGSKIIPTQKPVALMEYLIKTYTNTGEIVLDFCMGSGSTGIACINIGRNFIGIELDLNCFDMAEKRIYDWMYRD